MRNSSNFELKRNWWNNVLFLKSSNTELLTSDLSMTRFKVLISVKLLHSLLTDDNKLNRI